MPNLILDAEIDSSLIDQFVTDGLGFPDQTMLNPETGLRDSAVLDRMTGMTRAERRIQIARHKPGQRVMDYQVLPTGRMLLLINDLFIVQQRIKNKSKASAPYRSWEMVALRKTDSAWFAPSGAAVCSGLMKPDTHLGENARQIEVSDDQTAPYLFC
jgi:hypothetical protein